MPAVLTFSVSDPDVMNTDILFATLQENDAVGDAEQPINDWKETIHLRDMHTHEWSAWSEQTPATCTENGVEMRICTICGMMETRIIEAKGHQWDNGKVTKKATENAMGEKTYTCTACGELRVVEISATDGTPATGDNGILIWICLMIVCAVAILTLHKKRACLA